MILDETCEENLLKCDIVEDIMKAEKSLAELKSVTNLNTGAQMGKTSRNGLEVVANLSRLRSSFLKLLVLNFSGTESKIELEKLSKQCVEWELDQSIKFYQVYWSSLLRRWNKIVTFLGQIMTEDIITDRATKIKKARDCLKEIVLLEVEVSLHIEQILTNKVDRLDPRMLNQVQENEDRLNRITLERSKSCRINSLAQVRPIKYKKSKTTDLVGMEFEHTTTSTMKKENSELKVSEENSLRTKRDSFYRKENLILVYLQNMPI